MKFRLLSMLGLVAVLAVAAWADDTTDDVDDEPLTMAPTTPTLGVIIEEAPPTPTPTPLPTIKATKLPADAIWLDTMNLTLVTPKMGTVRGGLSAWGQAMKMGNVIYGHGVSMPGECDMTIDLKGNATSFEALVGLDDEVRQMGDVSFSVLVDGRTAFDSGEMRGGDPAKPVQVDLTGAKTMVLRVTEMGGADYGNNSDWGDAFIRVKPGTKVFPAVRAIPQKGSYPVVLSAPTEPTISGPAVFGASPNKPVLYRVPASGTGPLTFACVNLPAGLKIDAKTGIITGQVAAEGTYPLKVTVSNAKGKTEKVISLRCTPNALALTPPMGWSAYERFGSATSDAKVREAAQWLVKSGLAAHGYRTILLGDAWQGQRDAKGVLQPNKRFPNMKALGDYLHSLGLQFGIHSAATEHTATGAPGSAGHETQDAQMFADWGVDYLTYEWAPRPDDVKPMPKLEDEDNSQAAMEKGFRTMREALNKTKRDIVLSISVPSLEFPNEDNRIIYVRLNVAAMAKNVGAQVWSERNGLYDNWKVMSNFMSSKFISMVPYHMAPVPPRPPVTPPPVALPAALPLIRGVLPGVTRTVPATTGTTATTQTGVTTTVIIGGTVPTTGATTGATTTDATAKLATPLAAGGADSSGAEAKTPAGGAATPRIGVVIPDKPAPGTGAAGVAALEALRNAVAGVAGAKTTPTTPTTKTPVVPPVLPKIKPPVPTPDPAPGFWPYPGAIYSGRIGYPVAHLTNLTPSEQMYQLSLWSLFSMPLILTSDLARLDPNLMSPTTTAILTNDEVLDIDQDPLASPTMMVSAVWQTLIRTKLLSDGRVAVGLFNGTDIPRSMRVPWTALSMTGAQPVRDVWLHKDLGEFKDYFETVVPAHGVMLMKVGRPKTEVAN